MNQLYTRSSLQADVRNRDEEMRADADSVAGPLPRAKNGKAYKGMAMEGFIARWYARTQRKSIEQYRSWAKLASAHISEGGSVLEVAPGPGYLSIELARLGSYRIAGLDISKTFVDIASEKAREADVEIEFRQGDAACMPFPDGAFDFAICTSAFKNFPEPVKALDEIHRVLRAHGTALVVDMRREASAAELIEYVNNMGLDRVNSFITKIIFKRMLLKSAYTKSQIQEFVARSRFKTCDMVDEAVGREIWLTKS